MKYFINPFSVAILKSKMSEMLLTDKNAREDGSYFIRSLYFDDKSSSSFYDKLSGVGERAKYRIRLYNHDDSFILLEKKIKVGDRIRKESAVIDRAAAEKMIEGRGGEFLSSENPLLRDFAIKTLNDLLRPAVIVDYTRTAFIFPASDVRITLDERLESGLYSTDLFDSGIVTLPVLQPGESILEVKFNEFLSPHIKKMLSSVPAQRSAISKFVLCSEML